MRVWLREERFEAALPLNQRAIRPLTPPIIHELIRILRRSATLEPANDPSQLDEANDEKGEEGRPCAQKVVWAWVSRGTWISESQRVLQWGEPTACLFWEMLNLFLPPTHRRPAPRKGGGEDGTEGGSEAGVPPSDRVTLVELSLFLWLHLPDASTKVSTHPATYNVVWP
ncbi:hypothetical protein NGA_0109720, partial [Nannochloropsis gaditana CCMP526]|uniref:uncharacterized protein n=1 Tax=Nannochloropsis gaditana (strain CCMP526) TaxID=1093141 RepID=UPI00029F5725